MIEGNKRAPRDFTAFKKSLEDIASISLNEHTNRWKRISKTENISGS